MAVIHPVILAGGSGTRLWPLSRKSYPKQFSPLFGAQSLYQASLARARGDGFGSPVVLTGADFRFIVVEQLSELGIEEAKILIEPVGRGTAPAVLAAAIALEAEPDALMLVAPSDHVIEDEATFRRAVMVGAEAASQGRLVTFGIRPTRPETGYGYLALDEKLDSFEPRALDLAGFVEKPVESAAREMVEDGKHLWNAGIFLFRVRDILAAFEEHAPGLMAPVRSSLEGGRPDLGFFRLEEAAFASAEDISIDYAVMERAARLSVVPLDAGWSDLGSWDAVWRETAQDEDGIAATGNVTSIDCKDTLFRAESEDQHVVGIGLENMAVVAMRDAVLVAPLDRAQDVKDAVAALKSDGALQAETFPRCYRPWGWYETLTLGSRFQVKRIMVKPGAQLSLQSHVHRSEHWVVVEGSANVTVGDEVKLYAENQSVYIPLGFKHRLENPGKVELHLIEVQTGSYLGEDDIVRYEDAYARD